MQVEFFTSKIIEIVSDFDQETKNHIDELVVLLEENGSMLRMPYSKSIGSGIFELRALGTTHVRLLYCFHKNKAVILHVVAKKQNKLNNKDILLAKKRKMLLA